MLVQGVGSRDLKSQEAAENNLNSALSRLLAVVERYPDLKANENFIRLQNDLSVIESDIEKSRRYYNGAVRDLNIKVSSSRVTWWPICFILPKSPSLSLRINWKEKHLKFSFRCARLFCFPFFSLHHCLSSGRRSGYILSIAIYGLIHRALLLLRNGFESLPTGSSFKEGLRVPYRYIGMIPTTIR